MSHADTAQPRGCTFQGCAGLQTIHMQLHPTSTLNYRYLVMGLVKLRGVVVRLWICGTCSGWEDAGTKYPDVWDEPRPEIVNAIRRLKAAGHRFFDWEKTNA